MTLLVAIDGPAGSGKSSVAKAAARTLGFGMLDTGAGYRSLTWYALSRGVDLDAPAAIRALVDDWASQVVISLSGPQQVRVGETDVTADIRDPRISSQVSRVSKHPEVRERINELFREWVADSDLEGVVIEGRDITTVVAPHAPVRILLTASPEVRAQRRAGELPGLTQAEVAADLAARDAKDRAVGDFENPAPGVTYIDTSDLNFDESVAAVIRAVTDAQ